MTSIQSPGRTVDVDGITTPDSPYPSATRAGDTVYISGQVSFGDRGTVVGEGDIQAQTRCSLERLVTVLSTYGATLGDVVSCTVYLRDAALAEAFNRTWVSVFGGHRPSRATVVAELLDPRLLVEVQAIACLPQGGPDRAEARK
ncbi:2-iminobutanoate/2-iminopropanoate deaminase [Paenarthrobacter sp. TE4293]|uniref:RidA family protein n=1 Tax=Paenarthrobacter sp. TE4293 TaxID=3381695 RepID=UPI003D1C86A1